MLNSGLSGMLTSLMYVVPYALIYLVGLTLAILNWQRHPRVSLLCAIAFLLFLGALAMDAAARFWMMNAAQRNAQQISLILGMVSMVRVGISTVAWGLILTAMFSGRGVNQDRLDERE